MITLADTVYDYGNYKFTKNGKKTSEKAFDKYLKKISKYTPVEYYANEL